MSSLREKGAWRHSKAIADAYLAGKTLRELAEWVRTKHDTKTNHQTISHILKTEGIETRPKGGPRKEEVWKDAEEILRLYQDQGMYIANIARKYDVTGTLITKILKSTGTPIHGFGKRLSIWKHQKTIVKEYEETEATLATLAAKYSCASSTIWAIVNKEQ